MTMDDLADVSQESFDENQTGQNGLAYADYRPTDIQMLHEHIDDLERRIDGLQADVVCRNQTIESQQCNMEQLQGIVGQANAAKRQLEEQIARYRGDLSAEEKKVELIKAGRQKIDRELEEAHEMIGKEKKLRAEVEKAKRKLDMDIRTIQSDFAALQQTKGKLESIISSKDEHLLKLQNNEAFISSEKSKLKRKIDELKREMDDKVNDVDRERELRIKAEKAKQVLENQICELEEALQEIRNVSTGNMETSKRREGELDKLKHEIQGLRDKNEDNLDQLKRRHDSAINEMGLQIEYLKQEKLKAVKESEIYKSEISNLGEQLEKCTRDKDKQNILNGQLEERLEEYRRTTQDASLRVDEIKNEKKKCDDDIRGLSRMLDENSTLISNLTKAKEQLQSHLEHARHQIDEESRSRIALAAELRTVGTELDTTKVQLEDELENKAELERDVLKLSNSLEQFRKRFETERFERMREVEEIRSKLEMRCQQLEDQLDQAGTKMISLERIKEKLQSEIEDILSELEKANANAVQQERKNKRIDKLIDEWKQKCENTSTELAGAQNEAKYLASEIIKSSEQYAEAQEQIESLRRENRNLSEEIKSLMAQIADSSREAFDFDVDRKRLEKEKEELRMHLDEALSSKDEAEVRIRRLEAELKVQESEHLAALKDQEEDMLIARKQIERQLDGLQLCLDSERMGRREALAQRDHVQSQVTELAVELEGRLGEIRSLQESLNKDQERFEDYERQLREEALQTSMAKEAEIAANKRCRCGSQKLTVFNLQEAIRGLQCELDDLRTVAGSLSKQVDQLASELNRCRLDYQDLNSQSQTLSGRLAHSETQRMNAELNLEDKQMELRGLEERCSKLALDGARALDRLQIEEQRASELESKVSGLETLVNEANDRADNARADAMKACKATIQGLEDQLQQRTGELALLGVACEEQRRNLSKSERKIKEIHSQLQLANNHNDKLIDQNEGLQARVKLSRKQMEQAEEEAAQSMARFKAMADDLERAEARADRAENMVNKYRAASRFGIATGTSANTTQLDEAAAAIIPRGAPRDYRSMTRNI